MEFLVELEVEIPDGTPDPEVEDRERAEAVAAARLVAVTPLEPHPNDPAAARANGSRP
jgi:muconolactone delta-isomerase